MPRYTHPQPDLTDRVRQLESDLYMARENIIHLAPDEYHDLLHSYHRCASRSDAYGWVQDVAESIIDQVGPVSDQVWGQRVQCPLCRRGAVSYYGEQGFAYPEGLRRHLIGFGNTRMCPVVDAAQSQAQESWGRVFGPREREAQAREAQQKALRLKTEITYVLGPTGESVLIDGEFWHRPRPSSGEFSMEWAEQRLQELGFEVRADGLKRAYTRSAQENGCDLVLYADPRELGKISIRIFDATVKRGAKRLVPLQVLSIRDQWKNGLGQKVQAAIQAASIAGG